MRRSTQLEGFKGLLFNMIIHLTVVQREFKDDDVITITSHRERKREFISLFPC